MNILVLRSLGKTQDAGANMKVKVKLTVTLSLSREIEEGSNFEIQ